METAVVNKAHKVSERIQGSRTQREKLLDALRAAPEAPAGHPAGPGKWLALSAIMRMGIAQHSARMAELRKLLAPAGETIENYWQFSDEEQKRHSWYRIIPINKSADHAEEKEAAAQ